MALVSFRACQNASSVRRFLVVLLLNVSCAYAETLLEHSVSAELDWQPMTALTDSEESLRCQQCGGKYVDPLSRLVKADFPPSSDIQIFSDSTDVANSQLNFSGGVRIQQGYQQMTADEVSYDRETEIAVAVGQIALREPGALMRGESVTYDAKTRVASISNAMFVLHEAHMAGAAGSLLRDGDGDIQVKDGAVTFCAPDDPSWTLHTRRLELAPEEGIGEAHDAVLQIAGVPVMYLPWLQFPIDERRKTGLLFPDLGSDTRGGLDIATPVYLNLAPNYDLLYQPRYIQERGLLHQLGGRWLDKSSGQWELDGAWLSSDDKFAGENPGASSERWLVGLRQRAMLGSGWRTFVDYNRVSDADYIRDLNNETLSAQRQTALLQLGRVDWENEDWSVRIEAQQFQQLADDIVDDYRKLPQITTQWRGRLGIEGLTPIAQLQYSNFDSDEQAITGQRLYGEFGMSYPKNWAYGFIRPTVKYRYLAYQLQLDEVTSNTQPHAGSEVLSLDAGLVFERATNLGGEAVIQTLEPRAFYLYSGFVHQSGQPDFDSAELTFSYHQLFRETRFSGNDRLDDANQIAIGVTTRFFSQDDGRERLNASIGQIHYFRDRKVRLLATDPALTDDGSSIAAEMNWLPNDNWSLRTSLLYDTFDSDFEAASVQLRHSPGDGRVFNLGYAKREPLPSQRRQPVNEQANVSAYFPITKHWSVFGALEYSLEANNSVEDMFGLEFDDCCWRVRMLYMRYIDTASGLPDFENPDFERALQFQFVLKGLGGFGSRVDNLLRDMIRGFENRY